MGKARDHSRERQDLKLLFTVHGLARPAGSKRAFPFQRREGGLGVRVTDDNPKSRGWKNLIAGAAADAHAGRPLLQGPLRLVLAFYLPRPKGHFGRKGLLPSAPGRPIVKPDVLKLTRAVEDALSKVVWRDDAQIVCEELGKFYGEPARVEVFVEELN